MHTCSGAVQSYDKKQAKNGMGCDKVIPEKKQINKKAKRTKGKNPQKIVKYQFD